MQSVFKDQGQLFTGYDVELQFTGRLAGSLPTNPASLFEMVQRQMSRALRIPREEVDRDEIFRRLRIHLQDMGEESVESLTTEDLERLAQEKAMGGVNSFRRNDNGLYFPSHSVKAAMKEAVSILYAKERWGKTGKGPKGFIAERVFIDPEQINLITTDGKYVTEPDGVETLAGRVMGPQGPRSILTQHEYVEKPTVSFRLDVLKNGKAAQEMESRWPEIFSYMERNAMGSHRSFSGYGLFVTAKFEETAKATKAKVKKAA